MIHSLFEPGRLATLLVACLWTQLAAAQPLTTRDDAAGGCDGVKNGKWGFHTNLDDPAWWQVDLGGSLALERVVIFNRCDPIGDRAAHMAVLLSGDGSEWRTVYRHDGRSFGGVTTGLPLTVELDGETARFVRLQLPEAGYLHLDEIEVYGSQDPAANLALRRPADQSSTSRWSKLASSGVARPALEKVIAGGLRLAADLRASGVDVDRHEETLRRLAAEARKPPNAARALLREQVRRTLRELALSNPLLDFDRLLVIRRRSDSPMLGLPANWQGNCSLPRRGYDDEIAILSGIREAPRLSTLYRPREGKFLGDVDLHFDADRLLFSSTDADNRWQIYELDIEDGEVRQRTPGDQPDVDRYDACYLPNDDIIFCSTASFAGVPCVFGSSHVAVLYRMSADGANIRQLCFDQDHDWCPTVLSDGQVLYSRWEYADTPHTHSRILFKMHPDGTGQSQFYGSNSYWPNSFFYARPIPGEPTRVVGIVSGHHGARRMGELVILDAARGRSEAEGAVHRIPSRGRPVEARIEDRLVDRSWPKFLHPYPLSGHYFLVASKPEPGASWGIYLVDIFDNMTLIYEQPGVALLEPVPLRPTVRPPVIPDRVDLARKDALVKLTDIYVGEGLRGIPRGTVKRLRVFSYHYAYRGMGGLLGVLGLDGPWDIRRLLGTVPVEPDGSAMFRVPANTPISVQPLDSEGKAVQLMRSWMTAMPGEVLACVGCHENPNTSPINRPAIAFSKPPSDIEPWYGPPRGFSFEREVQPVLDKYCVDCHDGSSPRDVTKTVDLRGTVHIDDFDSVMPGTGGERGGRFSISYAHLHRFVRRPGIESDIHLLTPMEFHADTTELVQLLRKGHHGVRLDAESWDRLITWIDLNAPYHGTWSETGWDPGPQRQRRSELGRLYAGREDDPEADAGLQPAVLADAPSPASKARDASAAEDTGETVLPRAWPLGEAEAVRLQEAAAPRSRRSVDLGGGVELELVLIPAGEFLLGNPESDAPADERPLQRVVVDRPFWMGRHEVTNEQFQRFDPTHDSHVESKTSYQFGVHGYPVDEPRQPVVRVSWRRALEFCRWLSERTGERFKLPSEAEWEYACRAGAATAFHFGGIDVDFSRHANLADRKLRDMASDPYTLLQPLEGATRYDDWIPRDTRFDDGGLVSVEVGSYRANAWGLHDLHGNVAEWTRSAYRPYPYVATDGREAIDAPGRRVVRGGSWRDRPQRAHAAHRLAYWPFQPVYNVGFRVISEGTEAAPVSQRRHTSRRDSRRRPGTGATVDATR